MTAPTMKTCFKCGAVKPLDDFYRHSEMADGHLGKCIPCTKTDVAANYWTHRDAIAERERLRAKDPDRKAKVLEYQRARRLRSPEKSRARAMVSRALKSGLLVRQPCGICGSTIVQAHHADYSKPLDVEWLCFRHHREHAHGQVVTTRRAA